MIEAYRGAQQGPEVFRAQFQRLSTLMQFEGGYQVAFRIKKDLFANSVQAQHVNGGITKAREGTAVIVSDVLIIFGQRETLPSHHRLKVTRWGNQTLLICLASTAKTLVLVLVGGFTPALRGNSSEIVGRYEAFVVHGFDKRAVIIGQVPSCVTGKQPPCLEQNERVVDVANLTNKQATLAVAMQRWQSFLGGRTSDVELGLGLKYTSTSLPIMALKPTGTLEQKVDGGKVAQHCVYVQIQALLDDLRANEYGSTIGAIFAEPLQHVPLNLLSTGVRETSVKED